MHYLWNLTGHEYNKRTFFEFKTLPMKNKILHCRVSKKNMITHFNLKVSFVNLLSNQRMQMCYETELLNWVYDQSQKYTVK